MRVRKVRGQLHLSMPVALTAAFAVFFSLSGGAIALKGLRISSEGRAQSMFRGDLLQRRVEEETLSRSPELVEPWSPRAADQDYSGGSYVRHPGVLKRISPGFNVQEQVQKQKRTGFLFSLEESVKALRKEATGLIVMKEGRLKEADKQKNEARALAALYEQLKKEAPTISAGHMGMGMGMGAPMGMHMDGGGTPSSTMTYQQPTTTTTTYQQPTGTTMYQQPGTTSTFTGTSGQPMQGTYMQGTSTQGMYGGMQAGAQMGTQAGIQMGAQAGMQAGTQMGMQAGMQSGMQAGMQQGMPHDQQGMGGEFVMGGSKGQPGTPPQYTGPTREQYEQERQMAWQQHEQEMRRVAQERGMHNLILSPDQRRMMGMKGYDDFLVGFIEEKPEPEGEEPMIEGEEKEIVDGVGCLDAYTKEFVDGGSVESAVLEVAGKADLCGDYFATFELPGSAKVAGDVALHALTLGLMLKETPEQGVSAANKKLSELVGDHLKVDVDAGLLTSADFYALFQEEMPRQEENEMTIAGHVLQSTDGSLFLFNAPPEEGGESVLLGGNVGDDLVDADVRVLGVYDPESQTFVVTEILEVRGGDEKIPSGEEFAGPPMGDGQKKDLEFVGGLLGRAISEVVSGISNLSGVEGREEDIAFLQKQLPVMNSILSEVTTLIGLGTTDDPATIAGFVYEIKGILSDIVGIVGIGGPHGAPGPHTGIGPDPERMLKAAELMVEEMIPAIVDAADAVASIPGFETFYDKVIVPTYEAAVKTCDSGDEGACGAALRNLFEGEETGVEGMKAIFNEYVKEHPDEGAGLEAAVQKVIAPFEAQMSAMMGG